LRTQREARGIELVDIAESSKISLRYLESLESDRFEVLPAPVFVRGFLREYARIVGLDPDEVVNLFLVSAPRAAPERRVEGAPRGGHSRPKGSSAGPAVIVTAGIAILLAAAAGISYWAMRRAADRAPEAQAPAPSEALSAGEKAGAQPPVAAQEETPVAAPDAVGTDPIDADLAAAPGTHVAASAG